jgi:WD40 repeat protein
VLEYKIYVYNFADLKLVDHIETTSNTKGLCALCPYSSNTVLVCPGLQRGHVRVELYDSKKTTLIPAHETSLSCFALNFDGTLLATASEKGTLIRIFDTSTGRNLQEVRRGADRAEIYSLAFNYNSLWLACSSDKGTVHIFSISPKGDKKDKSKKSQGGSTDGGSTGASSESAPPASSPSPSDPKDEPKDKDGKKKDKKNPKSSLSFMKGFLPKYFSSEWSFAQFRVPDVRSIVAFGAEKNSIIVVSADGTFYKALFDPEKPGVECVQETFAKFIKTAEDET